MKFALIGKNISHSYSKIVHEKFNMYDYDILDINSLEIEKIINSGIFSGFNVTMPYKKEIISYCDSISENAKKIGSVNTVLFQDNLIKGYNTDYFGLKYTIERANISIKNKKVLIMGNGATSATAKVLCENLGAKEILVFSRKDKFLNYKNIYNYKNIDVIINTTPVGMYPRNLETIIDVSRFSNLYACIDVIYNPFYTKFILDSKKLGIKVAGGLPMLVAQAKKSAEIFSRKAIDNSIIEETINYITKKFLNIVLIGMPGSGKSTLAKILSNKIIGKNLIDTDKEIEKVYNMKIPDIFKFFGQEEFRKEEINILKNVGKIKNTIISTGGGCILNKNAYEYLKQNSKIYWIKRNLENLDTNNRPLCKNNDEIKKIYESRKNIYKKFSDKEFYNDKSIDELADLIVEDFYENTYY